MSTTRDCLTELFNRKKEEFKHKLWQYNRVEIRDVQNGEEPFLYSTLNRGPGYTDIKGSVGIDDLFELALELLAIRLILDGVDDIELIVGMMTGGSLPGYRLKQLLTERYGRIVRYIYQRGSRKPGGHRELDTGDRKNPYIAPGCKTLVMEELVNFAGTTTVGVLYERNEKKRIVTDAACILFYENPVAIKKLKEHEINLHYVVGLPELLDFGVANGYATKYLVDQYREFLRDPKAWNESRGFEFHA